MFEEGKDEDFRPLRMCSLSLFPSARTALYVFMFLPPLFEHIPILEDFYESSVYTEKKKKKYLQTYRWDVKFISVKYIKFLPANKLDILHTENTFGWYDEMSGEMRIWRILTGTLFKWIKNLVKSLNGILINSTPEVPVRSYFAGNFINAQIVVSVYKYIFKHFFFSAINDFIERVAFLMTCLSAFYPAKSAKYKFAST